MRAVLIQPRSPWGKQPYLPNGLLNVAARLRAGGVKTAIIDLNIDDLDTSETYRLLLGADVIGIGVLGTPCIPQAINLGVALRKHGLTHPIVLGGEAVMRLSSEHFVRIFSDRIGGDVRQVATEAQLGEAVGLLLRRLPSMYEVSAGPVISALPLRYRRVYFNREFCIFTSQGCKYRCRFCAATKGVPERFRDPAAFADEADVMTREVRQVWSGRIPYEAYLSTLDGCQNPGSMEGMLRMIHRAQERHGALYPLRFLATSRETVRAVREDTEILKRWQGYGLTCIGLGVDGDDEVTWKRERKGHNKRPEIVAAFDAITEAGIQPEALMVMGSPDDTVRALIQGVLASLRYAWQGIHMRPHVTKTYLPGTDTWSKGGPSIERLMDDPRLFLDQDYLACASPVTHPNPYQRLMVNTAYLATLVGCRLLPGGCSSVPLLPTASVPIPLRVLGTAWNKLMPQDR